MQGPFRRSPETSIKEAVFDTKKEKKRGGAPKKESRSRGIEKLAERKLNELTDSYFDLLQKYPEMNQDGEMAVVISHMDQDDPEVQAWQKKNSELQTVSRMEKETIEEETPEATPDTFSSEDFLKETISGKLIEIDEKMQSLKLLPRAETALQTKKQQIESFLENHQLDEAHKLSEKTLESVTRLYKASREEANLQEKLQTIRQEVELRLSQPRVFGKGKKFPTEKIAELTAEMDSFAAAGDTTAAVDSGNKLLELLRSKVQSRDEEMELSPREVQQATLSKLRRDINQDLQGNSQGLDMESIRDYAESVDEAEDSGNLEEAISRANILLQSIRASRERIQQPLQREQPPEPTLEENEPEMVEAEEPTSPEIPELPATPIAEASVQPEEDLLDDEWFVKEGEETPEVDPLRQTLMKTEKPPSFLQRLFGKKDSEKFEADLEKKYTKEQKAAAALLREVPNMNLGQLNKELRTFGVDIHAGDRSSLRDITRWQQDSSTKGELFRALYDKAVRLRTEEHKNQPLNLEEMSLDQALERIQSRSFSLNSVRRELSSLFKINMDADGDIMKPADRAKVTRLSKESSNRGEILKALLKRKNAIVSLDRNATYVGR